MTEEDIKIITKEEYLNNEGTNQKKYLTVTYLMK